MKKRFINQIRAGDVLTDCFVLAEKTMAQKKDGNNYLNLVLSDRTGSIKGVAWDNVGKISSQAETGAVVAIKGHVGEYRNNLQVVVKEMMLVPPDETDPSDFMLSTERDVDQMFERIVALTESLDAWYLKALFSAFWGDESFTAQFKKAPAAKKMHHAYIGGLLEHTLSMAVLADKIAEHYNGIDRDLLVSGAILHDIGKIREFSYDIGIDYSDEGRMVNHIVIGLQMIEEKIRTIASFPEEPALLLKHMVVSHHGSKELGSPEPPKTIEAVML
ncbi:MAG: HDIG domain-containing protein, partial [Deltaproteobacteria bacterium]|nr:HDIG domain-containing protein [Deltaproteobacteria bacterium]